MWRETEIQAETEIGGKRGRQKNRQRKCDRQTRNTQRYKVKLTNKNRQTNTQVRMTKKNKKPSIP